MRLARWAQLTFLLAATTLPAGCGGPAESNAGTAHPSPPGATPAPHGDAAVIRGWADTLRAGRVGAAARYFAVPAIVQNGTPPLRLGSRAAVLAFNRALPCGAKLLQTRRSHGYTIATFRLTSRRGADCSGGGGALAATAFRLRAGRIVEWRRVAVPRALPAAPSQSV